MEGKPTSAQSQDFDLMSALDWNEGVATLPGSNIRFRMSEFGTLELVTELEETDMPITDKLSPASPVSEAIDCTITGSPDTKGSRDGTSDSCIQEEACTNCGYCGKTEIFTNGKFCSWTCSQQHKKESKESLSQNWKKQICPSPINCPTPGCRGIGHIREPRFGTHHKAAGCPYSEVNLSRDSILHDRLSGERPPPSNSMQKPKRPDTPSLPGEPVTDSPHSKKSVALDGERSGRSSVLSLSEQSENGQDKDWPEEEPCVDSKPKLRRVTHSRAYIRLQLVQQDSDGKDTEFSLQQGLHQSVFMSSLSSNPTHRVHLCWEQHCKLLPEVSGFTAKNVAKWTVDEVASFVHRLPGCKEQSSVFRDEQIDGEAFLLLTQIDMVKILSIKLGPALKIYNAILMFKSSEEN